MKIINLTPHEITILNEEKEIVMVVPMSSKIARLDSDKELIKEEKTYHLNKDDNITEGLISFFATKYGIPFLSKVDKEGREISRSQLLPVNKDVIYIVSGLFRAGYPRLDLWQPGELVRDDKGIPIGCIGLSQ